MITKILIGLAVVLALFVLLVASRPGRFRYVRSMRIGASPETVFALVNDFRKWLAWSPWEKLDPDLKRIYSGAQEGVGSIYEWAGKPDVGEGRLTIAESVPAQRIRLHQEFLKPMTATNSAEFTFRPVDGGTEVVWLMEGTYSFMPKLFGLFINFDKMVGGQFEEGLANMKQAAEAESKALAQR